MPISPETIASFLDRPASREIPRWEDLPKDPVRRVTELRKRFDERDVSAMLEISELRHRARSKFSRAEEMFFDREGLEQSTGETIARWRAARFAGFESVADLTCGIGGDTLEISKVTKVLASDANGAKVRIARANVEAVGNPENVTIRTAPAGHGGKAQAYLVDPSRRATGKRSRHLAGLSPSLESVLEIVRSADAAAIKLSPATPDEELAELEQMGGTVEFYSGDGTCKEACVWFGQLSRGARRAVVLPGGAEMVANPAAPTPPVLSHQSFIFEPDPAVVRAGLIPELCLQVGAAVMDPLIAYLTVDQPVHSPFGHSYEVLASLPFSEKAIRGALRGLKIGRVEVKKRGTAVDLESIRRHLQSSMPGHGVVFMTRIGIRPWAFICRTAER